MLFTGDIAIAKIDNFLFSGLPKNILDQPWIVNLEGAIIDHEIDDGVYNASNVLTQLKDFNLGPVFIGNNHILDVSNGIAKTIKIAEASGLDVFGAGANTFDASKEVTCNDANSNFCLLGFGWSVIGCEPAKLNKAGVNPFDAHHVKKSVLDCINSYSDFKTVVVIHANYEFEMYPQPAHRQLARELIDLGAYAVIFHHPHIVGPVEQYQGRSIAYSLGNWAFSYEKFFNSKLVFPPSSYHQIALELGSNEDSVHILTFCPPRKIQYEKVEKVNSPSFSLRPEFQGFTDQEYINWFKINRKKRKLLPIYKKPYASLTNSFNDIWVSVRQLLIDLATRFGLKSHIRRS